MIKIKKIINQLTVISLFVAIFFSISIQVTALEIAPYYNNTISADSAASISNDGVITISNRYSGRQNQTTHAIITTYVEKKY